MLVSGFEKVILYSVKYIVVRSDSTICIHINIIFMHCAIAIAIGWSTYPKIDSTNYDFNQSVVFRIYGYNIHSGLYK